MTYAAISMAHFSKLEEWEEVQLNGKLQGIMDAFLKNYDAHLGYTFQNRKLLYIDKSVLPRGSSKIPTLLNEYHSTIVGGHLGFFITYNIHKFRFLPSISILGGLKKVI